MKGDPPIKVVVLIAILAPFYYLFLELAYRKIYITEDDIFIKKLFRKRIISKEQVDKIDTAYVKKKLFVILELQGKSPVVISTAYGRFSDLVKKLISLVGEDKASDTARSLPEAGYKRFSDSISVWTVIVVFIFIIIMRLL
jgi:hypothetical protein